MNQAAASILQALMRAMLHEADKTITVELARAYALLVEATPLAGTGPILAGMAISFLEAADDGDFDQEANLFEVIVVYIEHALSLRLAEERALNSEGHQHNR